MFYKDDRLALFIDGSNLYAAAKSLGFDIDYKLLRQEFMRRGKLLRALAPLLRRRPDPQRQRFDELGLEYVADGDPGETALQGLKRAAQEGCILRRFHNFFTQLRAE
jgi:hypothetical protein